MTRIWSVLRVVLSKKMQGLISFDDAVTLCVWPVAEGYVEFNGTIYPYPATGFPKITAAKPLADPNLFRSFSSLGARGDDLPRAAILRWIRKHGLLRLKEDPKGARCRNENQAPITFEEFRREARYAFEAETLFMAIRANNPEVIRPRISRTRIDPPGRPGEGKSADVYVDGLPIPMSIRASGELSDDDVLAAAQVALEWFVEMRLRDVRFKFDRFTGNPRPEEVYRPRLVAAVPDLYSSIWYQFACLVADTRPLKFCEICGNPIFRAHRGKKVCGGACRQAKSRQKKAREAAQGAG